MKNWKKISFALSLASILVITGCRNEEKLVSLDELLAVSEHNSLKEELAIENADSIKDFGRKAVGDFEKILFGIDYKTKENNKGIIDRYIRNSETAENFFLYTNQYIPYGMTIKKITFNKNTEKLHAQGGRYFYQVVSEAQFVRSGYLGIESFTYFLLINQDKKGNFFIEDMDWDRGHLLEGYQTLSKQGEMLITKEKLEKYAENVLAFETTDKNKVLENISPLFRTKEEAIKSIEKIHQETNEKRTLIEFVYDEDSLDISEELLENHEELSLVGTGKFGVIYKTQSGLSKKEAHSFEIILSQRNIIADDFSYVVDKIKLTPLEEFDWKK